MIEFHSDELVLTLNHSQLPSQQKQRVVNSTLPSSAYIHIPFCRRRCYYCDFPVSVVGDRKNGSNSPTIAQYVEVLCQEISTVSRNSQPLTTIFFGGGTPSLLSVSQLSQILGVLDRQLGTAADAEISLEIDPGTFTLEQLQGYQAAGVNRVSLGVQAFQDELLQRCGRSHTVSDIHAAVHTIHQVGIDNFSLDLISGLPHQTLEQWQASLEAAVALLPAHLSCYDLIVEAGTPFGRYYQAGEQPLPTDETAAQMYRCAQQILTQAGYEHYEISNYARPGYQCRHNRVYWENRAFYGFGMGAASYLDGVRLTRPRKTQEYRDWVRSLLQSNSVTSPPCNHLPDSDSSPASGLPMAEHEFLLETLMLGLRLAEGLSLRRLTETFGQARLQQIWHCLRPYHQQGWVEIVDSDGETTLMPGEEELPIAGSLRLTDPEGFLFSNTVLASLFHSLPV